jgi:hypothetical protein
VTNVTKSELPAYAQPYATELLTRGANLSQTPYAAYGGQRFAAFTPDQLAGLSMTRNLATQGNPAVNAATQTLADTVSGQYLRPETNPYLAGTVNQALGDVQSRVNAQFNQPGAFGSAAHQEVLQRGLGEQANALYAANYANERANQLRAVQLAPEIAQQDYARAQALLGVGDVYGQREQDILNQQYEDWLQKQNWPYQQLDVLSNALAGSTGGRSVEISQGAPVQYNRAATALGGGLLGYGLGGMLPNTTFGGYGQALGAGLGTLGGLLF